MMKRVVRMAAALVLGTATLTWAQSPDAAPPPGVDSTSVSPAWNAAGTVPVITPGMESACGCNPCDCNPCACAAGGCGTCGPSIYASVDFLLIRPHFSEAVAFAEISGAPPLVAAQGIRFGEQDYGYDPAYRLRAGSWFGGGSSGLRITYWDFDGDTEVDGVPAGATVLVDPFGNLVTAGARIDTEADVRMNVFDIEFVSTHDWNGGCTTLAWTVGARIADVDQSYRSLTSAAGVPLSFGEFTADFTGAGPRIGLEATHRRSPCSSLAFFATVHGSLLLGDYDVASSNTSLAVAALNGAQSQSMRRTIPVADMELGGRWQAGEQWSVAAGWMIQAWFDLGTSGGRFENPAIAPTPLFTGADDANIMSFDGFFLRAEIGF